MRRRHPDVDNGQVGLMPFDRTQQLLGIVGRRDDFRAAFPFGNTTTAGYVRTDLASSYTLPWRAPGVKQLSVFGRIENLFNKQYWDANGFRGRPLNFLLGIRANFGT